MADDEKILRIEAKISEDTKKVSDKPTASTSDTDAPHIPSLQEVADRSAHDALELSQREQEFAESRILSNLKNGDDESPLFSNEQLENLLAPHRQISSDEMFPPAGNSSEAFKPELVDLQNYYLGLLNQNAGGGGAPPAGATPPPIFNPPPLGMGPTPVPQPAGVIPPIPLPAGGGGGIPPVVPPVAGGGGLLPAGGLGGFALTALEVTGALTAFSAALLTAEEIIDATFQGLAQGWKDLSPGIQVAEARSELELTLEKLKTESQVSGPVAQVTNARTQMDTVWIDIRANLIQIIAPTLTKMMELVTLILYALNAILFVVKIAIKLNEAVFGMFGLVKKIYEKIFGSLNTDDADIAFSKEIAQVFGQSPADFNPPKFPQSHSTQKGTLY